MPRWLCGQHLLWPGFWLHTLLLNYVCECASRQIHVASCHRHQCLFNLYCLLTLGTKGYGSCFVCHSVIWNCVHFYATTKARTRSPRENIAIWLVDFAKTLAFSSYGWLTVMAIQPTAILLCHAQPFNRESRDGAMAGRTYATLHTQTHTKCKTFALHSTTIASVFQQKKTTKICMLASQLHNAEGFEHVFIVTLNWLAYPTIIMQPLCRDAWEDVLCCAPCCLPALLLL